MKRTRSHKFRNHDRLTRASVIREARSTLSFNDTCNRIVIIVSPKQHLITKLLITHVDLQVQVSLLGTKKGDTSTLQSKAFDAVSINSDEQTEPQQKVCTASSTNQRVSIDSSKALRTTSVKHQKQAKETTSFFTWRMPPEVSECDLSLIHI